MTSNEHYMAVDPNAFEEFYEREKKEFRDLYKDFIKYQQKVVEQGNRMMELLQKQLHLSDALLKQPLNGEICRAAVDAKVELEQGIKALQAELGLRKRIVENSDSHPPGHRSDIERGDSPQDTVMAGTREH